MSDYDWTKYEQLRDQGLSAHEVYRQVRADGYNDFIEYTRMLKDVFGVDLARAKEIRLQADGVANSLEEYQERLIPIVEEAIQHQKAKYNDDV